MASARLVERLAATVLVGLLGWQLCDLAASTGSSPALAMRAFESRAGEAESLPAEIAEANILVRASPQDLQGRLRLSPRIGADTFLLQRAAESLYPIRLSDNAPVVLAERTDSFVSHCREIRHSRLLGLYDCRPLD
jgi:hypothetical protein